MSLVSMESRPSFYPTFSEYGEGVIIRLQTTNNMVDGKIGMLNLINC